MGIFTLSNIRSIRRIQDPESRIRNPDKTPWCTFDIAVKLTPGPSGRSDSHRELFSRKAGDLNIWTPDSRQCRSNADATRKVYRVSMLEFSVSMANRPGQLASLARELATAGVNIQALAAMTDGPDGYIKLVVDDESATRSVLENAGVHFEERRVIDAILHDSPGALADMAEALSETGVNIEAMYLLHSSAEGLHFAVAVDDPESANQRLAG